MHEGRFGLSDLFDKSTYLTRSPRARSIIPFEGRCDRDTDLMAKGGDISITRSTLEENGQVPYYDQQSKL